VGIFCTNCHKKKLQKFFFKVFRKKEKNPEYVATNEGSNLEKSFIQIYILTNDDLALCGIESKRILEFGLYCKIMNIHNILNYKKYVITLNS